MNFPTSSPQKVFFDQALEAAASFAATKLNGISTTIVRDVLGRIRLAVDDRQRTTSDIQWEKLATDFKTSVQKYAAGDSAETAFIRATALSDFDSYFNVPERYESVNYNNIWILERQIGGQDWLRVPTETPLIPKRPRATLFGVKGGVGRSTTLAIWARHLAVELKKRVLVIDLDLESPGVSSLLLSDALWPQYGLVDYLIEAAVGQEEGIIPHMSALSALGSGGQGQIVVVPAYGAVLGEYVSKLNRIYQGIPDGPPDFAGRLCAALAAIEKRHQPDVVLLDSRAGLHDIAAVALARIDALSFLFAIGTPQTIAGYKILFRQLRHQSKLLQTIRSNMQVVAAMVPELDRNNYMEKLRNNMHRIFGEYVYDQDSDSSDPDFGSDDRFTFGLEDIDAPHRPIPIYWYRLFQEFDPIGNPAAVESRETNAAFGHFLETASDLLLRSW